MVVLRGHLRDFYRLDFSHGFTFEFEGFVERFCANFRKIWMEICAGNLLRYNCLLKVWMSTGAMKPQTFVSYPSEVPAAYDALFSPYQSPPA